MPTNCSHQLARRDSGNSLSTSVRCRKEWTTNNCSAQHTFYARKSLLDVAVNRILHIRMKRKRNTTAQRIVQLIHGHRMHDTMIVLTQYKAWLTKLHSTHTLMDSRTIFGRCVCMLLWSFNQMIRCGIPQKCQHKLAYASNGTLT